MSSDDSNKTTFIIQDVGMSKYWSNYADYNSDKTFETMAKVLIAYFYTKKKIAFNRFKTTSSDPKDQLCFGPIIVRAERKQGEAIAIARFIHDTLKLPLPDGATIPHEDPECTRGEHYIVFKDQEKELATLPFIFHRNEQKLYLDQFTLGGRRQKKDPCQCTAHSLPKDVAEKATPEQIHDTLIAQHIKNCLNKEVGGPTKPPVTDIWVQAYKEKKLPASRDDVKQDVWKAQHPLFKHFGYDQNDTVILDEKTVGGLEAAERNQYNTIRRGMTVIPETVKMTYDQIVELEEVYSMLNMEMGGFWLLEQWTPSELLTCLAAPPVPLPGPKFVPLPDATIDRDRQECGIWLNTHLKLITDVPSVESVSGSETKKGGKGGGASKKLTKEAIKAGCIGTVMWLPLSAMPDKYTKQGPDGEQSFLVKMWRNIQGLQTEEKTDGKMTAWFWRGESIHAAMMRAATFLNFPYEALLSKKVPTFDMKMVKALTMKPKVAIASLPKLGNGFGSMVQ